MKVILWAPLGAGTHYWGPGTSAYRLYRLNKDPNIKVTLVHGSKKQGDFPDVYYEQVKLGDLEKAGLLRKISFFIKSLFWIVRNHKHYDVMHGLGPFWDTFFPALFFARLGGKSFIKITDSHAGFGTNSLFSKLTGLSLYRRKNAHKITGYISLSKKTTDALIKAGIKKEQIHAIPNGVDTSRFHPVSNRCKQEIRQKLNLPDKYTFIFCGGLSHRKRVLETVQAAYQLLGMGIKDFQLLIVGPDRSADNIQLKLKDYIEEKKLHNSIFLIDDTKTPELYYQASNAYILASKSEGMSNSLLEAMACALPSIVTKISGSEDLVTDGVHGLHTTGKIDDIAKCMLSLYSNAENNKMGATARKKILEAYTAEAIWEQHVKLFRKN